jgi:Transposase DDE domain
MSDSFDLEVCRRLPLAEGTLRLFQFALADDLLDDVFARHRGRSYEDVLCFPQFVRLLADGLLGQQRSGHQTFQRAIDEGNVDVSLQAIYGKLRRVPIGLSQGLFDSAAARLREVAPAVSHPMPASLGSFWALCFDGKKLKHVLHRLKPLRGLKGKVFGGKLLVVQDMATRQAVTLEADEDGETADNPLVPGVVARVRNLDAIRAAANDVRPRLWVADRAFCEYTSLPLLASEGDHYVVRFSAGCKFHPDSSVPIRHGKDRENRSFEEAWGWLGKERHLRVRQITVTRPGQKPFVLVTSLLDADRFVADDLLALYRARWGIEAMFQQTVQTFDLRHLIGGTAQATVFQAVLCFLAYNTTLIVRDFVARSAQKQPAEVSLKILFDDVADELTGWLKLLDAEATIKVLDAHSLNDLESLRNHLDTIFAEVWVNRWTKAPTRKQPAERKPRAYLCGGHSSVDKILRGVHHEIPLDDRQSASQPPPYEAKKDV